MKTILNGKLYDTDKAECICGLIVPQNDFDDTEDKFNIYKTAKGNIFAEHKNAQCLIDESTLKTILSKPNCVSTYIELFGEPEEA